MYSSSSSSSNSFLVPKKDYEEREKKLRDEALSAHILNIFVNNEMTYFLLFDSRTKNLKKTKFDKMTKTKRKMSKLRSSYEKRRKISEITSNFWLVPNARMKEKDIRDESNHPFVD